MREEELINSSNWDLAKLLAPFLKPYIVRVVLILLLLPLGSFAFSVQPLIIQKAIDGPLKDLQSGAYEALTPYVFALVGAIVATFVIQITMLYSINKLGQLMVTDIRYKLFSHLESLPMAFFDQVPVGRNVTRITNDMESLAESFAGGLILTMVDLVNAAGIIFFMLYLDLKLSLAVIFLLLPMYFLAVHFQSVYRQANLKARAELSRLNSFLQQNVIGIEIVQALNSASKSMRRFAENNQKYFDANDTSVKADAQFSASIEFVSITAIAILIFLSEHILLSGLGLSIGVLVAFLQYTQSLFDPIRNLSDRFTIIQSGFTSAERILALLQEPEAIKDPEHPISLAVLQSKHGDSFPTLEFENIYFRYSEDSAWVFEDFSMVLEPGETLAITGRTGSGKSTIIKLLTRLYEIESGSIKINGVDIRDFKQSDLRQFITSIHQESYTFEGDLRSNIVMGREDVELSLAEPFLEILKDKGLELDSSLDSRAKNISAGSEQVINFARAIISKPKIIVLDEATANMDLQTEALVLGALKKYQETNNVTLISIAHRLDTVADYNRNLSF